MINLNQQSDSVDLLGGWDDTRVVSVLVCLVFCYLTRGGIVLFSADFLFSASWFPLFQLISSFLLTQFSVCTLVSYDLMFTIHSLESREANKCPIERVVSSGEANKCLQECVFSSASRGPLKSSLISSFFFSSSSTPWLCLQGLRFKKAHVTHPDLKATFSLPIIGVKKNPNSPMYTSLGVITKGTIVEVRRFCPVIVFGRHHDSHFSYSRNSS